MKKLFSFTVILALSYTCFAQLIVVATNDTNFCRGGDVQITANATGGTTPYVFNWLPATGLGCTNCQSPLANPTSKTTYTVTVRDVNSNISIDSVTVNPIDFYMYLNKHEDTVCLGSAVQLDISMDPTKCGVNISKCFGAETLHTAGTGTMTNIGTGWPAPFASWYWGAKQQYLFKSSELNAIGMDRGTISELSWYLTSLNSFNEMKSFSIKMMCTPLTELTSIVNISNSVHGPATLKVSSLGIGWNTIELDRHFDWDGESNILIEVCYFNGPLTSNGNPSCQYTTTTFRSFVWIGQSINTVCTWTGFRTGLFMRPNTRFTLCKQTPLGMNFTWNPTAGLSDPNIYNPLASPTSTTTYVISVNNNGCLKRDTAVIVVKPKATADFNYSVVGRDAFFTDKSTGGNSIKWLFGDGASSSAKYPIHYYAVGGMYDVSLIIGNSFDCPDTSTQKVDMTHIGINDLGEISANLNVFPNPFINETEIRYSLSNKANINLELYSILGTKVSTLYEGSRQAGEHRYVISASELGLTSGIYIIKMNINGREVITDRLVQID